MEEGRSGGIQGQHSLNNMSGINERMSAVVSGLADARSELQHHRIEMENLRRENRELRTIIQSKMDQLSVVHTSQMRIEHCMQQMMRQWGQQFGASTPVLLQRGDPSNSPDDDAHAATPSPSPAVPTATPSPLTAVPAVAICTDVPNRTTPTVRPMFTAQSLVYAAPNSQNKTKGIRNPQHSVGVILRTMYEQHKNLGFLSLEIGLTSKLEDQMAWVWTNMFAASSVKDKPKITKALKLIDCLWTSLERKTLIEQKTLLLDVIPICKRIEKRVVQAAYLLRKNPPTKAAPSRKATGGLLGIANSIGKFDLEPYLPQWERDGETRIGTTLQQLVEEKIKVLQQKPH
jgi:hypothetical protein